MGTTARRSRLTEVGWSSGSDRAAPLVVGPRSQARNLERAFAVAGERRFRVSEIDWYAWQDSSAVEAACTFCEQARLSIATAGPSRPGARSSAWLEDGWAEPLRVRNCNDRSVLLPLGQAVDQGGF